METQVPIIPRVLPALDKTNTDFWTAGFSNELRLARCQNCGWWIHAPAPVCRRCLSNKIKGERTSGLGIVVTYTINRHQWGPDAADPYVVAIVELPEQEGLRLTTNIVKCRVEDVHIGMLVRVTFERIEDVCLPVFEPMS
jgi:uncharacterized OB-fold protein